MIILGEKMKKYQNCLLAFFIPIGVVLIGLLLNNFYPFGDKILLMLDGYNQYPGFLNSFKDKFLQIKHRIGIKFYQLIHQFFL